MSSKKSRNQKTERVLIPLLIPIEEGGAGEIVLGFGDVRGSTLVINFNDLIPAQAIRNRIERGDIVGITFVIPEDEAAALKTIEDDIQKEQDDLRARKETLRAAGYTEEQIQEALAESEGLSDRDIRDLNFLGETVSGKE